MDITQIIQSINGADDQKKAKAAFTILNELYDMTTGDLKKTGSISLCKPKFKIERHGRFVQVDMTFMSYLDTDLTHIMLLLNQFGNNLETYSDSENIRPVFTMAIVPLAYEGKAYVQAMNPIIWTKTSENATGNTLNTIRILFESIDFNAFENPQADVNELKEEIEKEAESKRYIEEQSMKEKENSRSRYASLENLSREEYLEKALYEETKTISRFEDLL